MSNVLDLSSNACHEVLSFNASSRKMTGTGMQFFSYNGLRMYLITGKKTTQYLRCAGSEIKEVQGDRYTYVNDLWEQLEDALRVNIAKFPLLKMQLNKKTQVVWTAPFITEAEQKWVDTVRRVAQSF